MEKNTVSLTTIAYRIALNLHNSISNCADFIKLTESDVLSILSTIICDEIINVVNETDKNDSNFDINKYNEFKKEIIEDIEKVSKQINSEFNNTNKLVN